jgi:hypothetical protein
MKRLIDGVTYNTETATLLARDEGEWGSWAQQVDLPIVETLYQTRSGNFFISEEITIGENEDGNEITKYRFKALREEAARSWMMKGANIEVFRNPFEEKFSEDETEGTIYARIPASLKRKIEESAKADDLSANAWAMRCFEKCLSKNKNVWDDIGYIWWLATALTIADDKGFELKDVQRIAEEIADLVEHNWKSLGFNEDERFDRDLSNLAVSGRYTNRESQLLTG